MMKKILTKENTEILEDLLTEMLYLALVCAPHIRPSVSNLCEGIADQLEPIAVDRCMDYARFRKDEYAKTLPGFTPQA